MYKLEDRILFDAAAVADVADAQQEADAQAEAAAQAAEEAAAQEAAESADDGDFDNTEADDPGSLEAVLAAVEAGNLGSDGQRVDVLLVSNSLENAEDIINATSSDTIVVRYDARTTSAADLLQQITDALDGNLADSIGFATESGENAEVQLFADTDTSLDTVNDSIHQDFFNGLNTLLDEGAQVNLFASNLASTAEGTALVDAIGDSIGHDVAASSDETGAESAGGDWNLEYSTSGVETDLAETYLDENLIDNFDSLLENHTSREVAFINSSVKDVDKIIAELDSDTEIIMLEQGDAVAQINEYLSEHSDIDTIRIFTHGNAGYINLGSIEVDSQYITDNPDAFVNWGDSLSEDADILIYGCNLAENAEGQSLINTISSITGADVAASVGDIGVDGNWTLEFTVGVIEAKDIYVAGYQYNLAQITLLVESLEDNPILIPVLKPYTLRQAIYVANNDLVNTYKITFANESKLGGRTITLTAGEMVIENDITILGYSHIEGSSYNLIHLDAQYTSRHFVINEGTNAILDSFRFLYGREENGGSIYNAGNLQLNATGFLLNNANNAGGAVYNTGDLLITSNAGIGITWISDISFFSSNSAVTAGGAIYNVPEGNLTIKGQSTTFTVDFNSNRVTNGSGGAIYSLGAASFTLGIFDSNDASADGGAVYLTSLSGSTHFDTVDFSDNSAGGDGGGLYFTQGDNVLLEWSDFDNNTAVGNGGAVYFSSSGKLEIVTSNSTVGKNLENHFDGNSAGQNGGAIYMDYSGSLNVDFVRFNNNNAGNITLDATSGGSGGAIYVINSGNVTLTDVNIEGGSARAGTANAGYGGGIYVDSAITTITSSNISNNSAVNGAGIYQMAGTLSLTNVTLSMNTASGNGGGIWFGNGSLSSRYATLAYNSATGNGSAIYFNAPTGKSTIEIVNSLVYESSAPTSQIYLSSDVSVSSSSHNMFSHYNTNVGSKLSNEVYTPIERYYPGEANPREIGQMDGWGNIVGHNAISINEIQTYTYLDTTLKYHANYRTRALAILYNSSLAYQRGTSVVGVSRDQRGNNRGSSPSIGAFEPLFYATVTSNGDDSALAYSNDINGIYFSSALEDGLTLREAAYWLDTYDTTPLPTDIVVNTDRYVKFNLPDGYQINITYGAIKIGGEYLGNGANKEIRVSITPDSIWSSDSSYVAQDADNRIIVDANNTSGIFDVFSGSTFILSNLTLQNGTVDTVTTDSQGEDFGRGGGIYNEGISYLHNVVVQNSTASNKLTARSNSWYAGWGGGIYNSGTMYIYDSTITENTTTAYATDKLPTSNSSKGGGIYNEGTMVIQRSTIDNNTSTGNVAYNVNAAQGGGIYNDGNLTIANSTIAYNLTNSSQASDAAAGAGSGIFVSDKSTTYINYCTIIYNNALLHSGDTPDEFRSGITVYDDPTTTTVAPTFSLINSIVAQNTARVNDASDPEVTPRDIYISSADVILNDGGHNIIGYFNTAVHNWANATSITGDTANNDVLYHVSNVLEYNGGKSKNFRLLSGSYALTNGVASTLYTSDQRGAERPTANTSIGAYQILEYVYISSNADSNSTPSVSGFDFAANKPGFLADTVTLRDSFYWADPGTKIVVRYLDGSSNWVINPTTGFGNEIKLINGEIYITKSLTIDGTVKYYNYVDNTTGEKIIIDFSATNHYSYVIGGTTGAVGAETPGETVYYDNSWGKYYYMSSGSRVYLNTVALAVGATTKVDVMDGVNVKYSYYTETATGKRIVRSGSNYFYLEDTDSNRIAIDTIAAVTVTSTSDYTARTFATGDNLDVNAQKTSRIFNINNNDESWVLSVGIADMTLRNGYTLTGNGGAIYSFETLSTTRVDILDSEAKSGFGGGVYVQVGNFEAVSSNFNGNKAGQHGGGVYSNGGNVYIENSSFESNTATLNGGGLTIIATRNSANIFSSTFYNNTAGEHGGGISIDSSYSLFLNSTISNNTAGYNGGGIYFTGGADLELGYVTVANNTAGSEGDVARNRGGGVYQAAGTFVLANSIVAQNWSLDVDKAASHSDYFAGVSVSVLSQGLFYFGGGYMTTGSSIMGESNRDFSGYNGMIVLGTVGNTGQSWNDLLIDTDATNNGGIYDNVTKTVYVLSDNSLAVDNADVNKIPIVVGLTDVDQRGITRTAGTITIGAFQRNNTTYYLKDGFDPTLASSWNDQIGGGGNNATSFTIPDQTFIFDNDTVTIASNWDVGYKNTVQLGFGGNNANITISGDDTEASLNLVILAGSTFTVAGGTFQSAPSTSGYSVINNSGTFAITGGTTTGNIILGSGSTLTISAIDNAWKDFTVTSIDSNSTVVYNYAKTQTIRTLSYGNLTISGTGIKTANGDITVVGNLSNSSQFNSSYDLSVNGNATGNGNLNAVNIYLNGTSNNISGNLTASQTLTFAGGNSTGTMRAVTANLNGTVENIHATTINSTALNVTGTATSTNLNAMTLGLSSDASVATVNAAITNLSGSGTNSNSTLKVTGAITNVNSWVIAVSDDSTLNIDRGSNAIEIIQGTSSSAFNADNMAVDTGSTLKFITTNNITLTDIVSGSSGMADFDGTLWLKCQNIVISEYCDFGAGDMSLVLENSGFFDIKTGATLTFNNGIGLSNVRIVEGTGNDVIIRSKTGFVTILGNVTSDNVSSNYTLTINASTSASVENISGITDLTINASTTATVNGVVNISGDFKVGGTANTIINGNVTTVGKVELVNDLALAANINASGNVIVRGTTTVTGNASIKANSLSLDGTVSGNIGTENLSLTATSASTIASISNLGNLTFNGSGVTYTMSGSITNVSGTLTNNSLLGVDGNNVEAALLINNGRLTAATVIVTDLNNTGIFNTSNTTVNNNLINSGTTFDVTTAGVRGNITNTGNMTIDSLILFDDNVEPKESILSLNGTVNITSLSLNADKKASLTSGNIAVTNFTFDVDSDPTSKFALASGTSLDVTNINYNTGFIDPDKLYDGNYFNTEGGGQLVRTMTGSAVEYRVGNSDSATVITLSTTAGEKIAAHVLNFVKFNGGVVTGSEDTAGFTTVLERNWGGAGTDHAIDVTVNWSTALEGDDFDPAESTNLFVLNGSWSDAEGITVSYAPATPQPITPPIRREATILGLPHNGTYAFANAGANMTIPITNLNGNIALWEMSNPNYSSILGDVDNLTNFPIGQYPYFSTRGIFGDPASVGRSVYRHMEYRMAMNPLSNPLTGQVPAPGTLLGQAITEGADLNLTSDASVYLEVNGEYSVGRGWLPVGEPVSAANVEQYQAPITEGQLDEFYLEFGGRENIFDKPTSFRSDLDEILDDLLAG